jgi:hypothetical protein
VRAHDMRANTGAALGYRENVLWKVKTPAIAKNVAGVSCGIDAYARVLNLLSRPWVSS